MDDHIKEMSSALAVATWERKLGQKDVAAERKRREDVLARNRQLTNDTASATRRQRLKALYQADNEMYEEELQTMGLTFRKERS